MHDKSSVPKTRLALLKPILSYPYRQSCGLCMGLDVRFLLCLHRTALPFYSRMDEGIGRIRPAWTILFGIIFFLQLSLVISDSPQEDATDDLPAIGTAIFVKRFSSQLSSVDELKDESVGTQRTSVIIWRPTCSHRQRMLMKMMNSSFLNG